MKVRHFMSRFEAILRLQQNGVTVVDEVYHKNGKIRQTISTPRPIGLACLAAVDCLIHYHNFRRV